MDRPGDDMKRDSGEIGASIQYARQLGKDLPPPCLSCGGRLKPEVVFFGEPLPAEALTSAAEVVAECDLLIAIGSSLQIYPAASLPEMAKINGAKLMIVNKTPTPFDHLTDALLCGNANDILPKVFEWKL